VLARSWRFSGSFVVGAAETPLPPHRSAEERGPRRAPDRKRINLASMPAGAAPKSRPISSKEQLRHADAQAVGGRDGRDGRRRWSRARRIGSAVALATGISAVGYAGDG